MRVRSRILVVGSLALGFAFGNLAMSACDNMRPSESTGACKSDVVTCGSYDNQAGCLGGPTIPFDARYVVKQDFPTSCVTGVDCNCNQPLRNCYRYTGCEWSGGQCVPEGDNNNPWIQVTKRESVFCGVVVEPGESEH